MADDLIVKRVEADFEAAMKIAGDDPAVIAGLVQAMAIYRTAASRPTTQAGPTPKGAQPAPASGKVPNCPKCGAAGQVNKYAKPGSKAPPFQCTQCTTEAKNGKTYATGIWPEQKAQNTAYAKQYERQDQQPLDEFPKALEEGDDDLPF